MTKTERIILIELLSIKKEILLLSEASDEAQDIENQIVALKEGYTDFYDLEIEMPEEKDASWSNLILDILNVYSRMINSIERDQGSKHEIELQKVKFPGFDGNSESDELYFVKYFILGLKRFAEIEELNKSDYNSHRIMMPEYQKMLDVYEEMGKPVVMTDEQINKLLDALK